MAHLFSFSYIKKDLKRYGPSDYKLPLANHVAIYVIYHYKLLEIYIK